MVKRYDFYDRNDDAARAHVVKDGQYVTYADYTKLQGIAAAMQEALLDIVNAGFCAGSRQTARAAITSTGGEG